MCGKQTLKYKRNAVILDFAKYIMKSLNIMRKLLVQEGIVSVLELACTCLRELTAEFSGDF